MYMTQETFGNKINANGKTMKKKQMWTLEPSGDGATVCLKSNSGKYLIVDKFGNVTCDSEEKEANDNPKFEMSIMADKSGRLAFKSMSRGTLSLIKVLELRLWAKNYTEGFVRRKSNLKG